MLEKSDRHVLEVLQREGRISNQDLAERTGMSASACWRRVRALEDAGLIRGYRAVIDADGAGLSFHAIVHVSLTRHEADHVTRFISEIRQRPEVLDCFATTGDADYHLRVRCPDIAAYNRFLDDFLFRLPGIANVRTNLVLKEIKHDTPLSL